MLALEAVGVNLGVGTPQAQELQRLEAERRAILQRRAPQLLEQPAADGADAQGAAGELPRRVLVCCADMPPRSLKCVRAQSSSFKSNSITALRLVAE